VVFDYYDSVLGCYEDRTHALDLDLLGFPSDNLTGLDHCFSMEEVWSVISSMLPNKALGPDGFTGRFYQTIWPVIKDDVMHVLHAFWTMDFRSLYLVNEAYIILLKKKRDAEQVYDFRPISLIHSFGKLVFKILSVRLAPLMHLLVRSNQTVFIKGHVLHDNFGAVQSTTKVLHAHRRPSALLKIDIAKVFDTVGWAFPLVLLSHLGFSHRWCNWVLALLSMASTRIPLNGHPGHHICHVRGLRPTVATAFRYQHGGVERPSAVG
jgi:hypothetical protein